MKKILLVLMLGLLACDEKSVNERYVTARKEIVNETVEYYKDKRTGLCFATAYLGSTAYLDSTHAVMTNVPCSPEVERLLK